MPRPFKNFLCNLIIPFFFALIIITIPTFSAAGAPDPAQLPSDQPRKDNPCREEIRPAKIWDDISHTVAFPARMDLTDGLLLAGVLGSTGILMSQDENIRGLVKEIPINEGIKDIASVGKWLGDGRLIVPLFLASGAGGYLGKNQRLVRISVETLEALALSGLTVQILKISTGRSRPYRDSGSWDFTGPSFSDEAFHSFPSGHAVTISSVVGVLAGEFGSIWIDLAAGSLMALTAFQRNYADKHWASDVFLGSAIGIATGYSIARHRKEKAAARILITPAAFQKSQPGIQFTYIF